MIHITDSYQDKLAAVIDGSFPKEQLLQPLLEGLAGLLSTMEQNLGSYPEEVLEDLQDPLNDLEDAIAECERLARLCLAEDEVQVHLRQLGAAHSQLNQLLLDFHEKSWLAKGPTSVAWLNKVFDSTEEFLSGKDFRPGIGTLVRDRSKELSQRALQEGWSETEEFIAALQKLSSLLSSNQSVSSVDLRNALELVKSLVQDQEDFLCHRGVSLEELVLQLEGDLPLEERSAMLQQVAADVQQFLSRLRGSTWQLSSAKQVFSPETNLVLDSLKKTLASAESALHKCDEETEQSTQSIEELCLLYEDLEEALSELRSAMAAEQSSKCPNCGEKNSVHAKLCGKCSHYLQSERGSEDRGLDLLDSAASQEQRGVNVENFEDICRAYQHGESEFTELASETARLQGLLGDLEARLPQASSSDEKLKLYLEALDSLGSALQRIESVEAPEDPELEVGLADFLDGVDLLRKAQKLEWQSS